MADIYKVTFALQAEEQLDQLYTYIANDSGEDRADAYINGIVTHCRSLASFPERGTKRDDIRPNLRIMGHKRSATIAFSINYDRQSVTILGVFYKGRNFEISLDDETD